MVALALRPYQSAAIDACRQRIANGRRAPLLVAPTGAGKTVMEAAIAAAHLERSALHRVLVVAHRRELVQQIAGTFRRFGLDVGEIHPAAEPHPEARVQVASTQTLLARGDIPNASLVIIDEAHHYAADEWSALTEANPDAIRCGFTATPARSDGRGLSPAFDSLVEVATIKQLTKDGFLVPCKVIAPEKPLRSRQLVQSPVEAYLEHAGDRPTVVFAEFVADAEAFAADFRANGITAAVVHGELSVEERDEALRAHREEGAVLVNVMCLTEGWDSPATSVCILARGCGSVGMYLQIVGRILRPAPGKSDALLVDLTGRAFYTHGAPDEEREFSLTGKAIRTKGRQAGATCFVCGSLVNGWPCGVCGHQPEGVLAEPIKIVGGTLAERFAKKREEDEAIRTASLARWMAEYRQRGWKAGGLFRKYTAVYGAPPSSRVLEAARLGSYEIRCTDCTSCGRATAKTYRGGQCGKCAFEKGRAA